MPLTFIRRAATVRETRGDQDCWLGPSPSWSQALTSQGESQGHVMTLSFSRKFAARNPGHLHYKTGTHNGLANISYLL